MAGQDRRAQERRAAARNPAEGPQVPGMGPEGSGTADAFDLLEQGSFEEAEARLWKEAEMEESTDMHCNAGQALLDFGRVERAMEHFRRAEQLDPDHAGVQICIGYVLGRM